MKFVCDNCQAKYQIGDDKVAGKTVRMKCRKCGFNIKVSAADIAVPSGNPAGVAQSPPIGTGQVSQQPIESMSSIGISAADDGEDDATSLMSHGVRDAVLAATAPRAPAAAPRPVASPPSPSRAPRPMESRVPAADPHRATGDRLRAVGAPGAPAVTSIPAPRPLASGGPVRAPSGTMPRPAGLSPTVDTAKAPRPVTRTSSGQVAAVRAEAPHAPAPVQHAAPISTAPAASATVPEFEWYVGIAGTPIGPVRLSVIRERAAAHEVDGESLVWREGMSEWRALKNYPELLEAVNEARSSPAAAVPQAAPAAPAAPASPVKPDAPAPLAAVAALAPPARTEPAVGGALGAVEARQTNGKANGFHASLGAVAMGNPEGVPQAQTPPVGGAQAPPAAVPQASPEGQAAVAQAAAVAAPSPPKPAVKDELASLEESLIPRRRGGVHPMAYAFVAAAAVFGGVAAWVLLRPQPPPQIVFVQQPAVATPPTPSSPSDQGSGDVQIGEIATGSSAAAPHVGGRAPAGAKAPPTTPTGNAGGTPVAPIDTSSFPNSVPGPAATGPAPSGPGGGLSASEISAVVAQNQAIIKRKCWVPALEAKAPSSPANARVVGNLVIGPSGNVDSATASGGDSFPGLASCIQSRMKNWHFPASGGTTPVQVPFVFAGQ